MERNKEPMELAHEIYDIQQQIKYLMKRKKKLQTELKRIGGKKTLQKVRYGKMSIYFEKPIMLYALRLENDFYYIGMSRDPDKRFIRHSRGKGSMWTKLYKPLEIIEIRDTKTNNDSEAGLMEDQMTLEYAERFGYDCVRGGGYCQRKPRWPTKSPVDWIEVLEK